MPTKLTPFTTRPWSTSKQGIMRFANGMTRLLHHSKLKSFSTTASLRNGFFQGEIARQRYCLGLKRHQTPGHTGSCRRLASGFLPEHNMSVRSKNGSCCQCLAKEGEQLVSRYSSPCAALLIVHRFLLGHAQKTLPALQTGLNNQHRRFLRCALAWLADRHRCLIKAWFWRLHALLGRCQGAKSHPCNHPSHPHRAAPHGRPLRFQQDHY